MTKRKVTPLFAVVLGISTPAAAGTGTEPVQPRSLPNGAPACGNTQSKQPRPCDTEAKPAPAPSVAMPRTLPTGAPACGNVLEKAYGDTTDHHYLACLRGDKPAVAIDEQMTRQDVMQRQIVRRVLSLLGIAPVNGTVARPTEPRRMRSGAPACGNVATRSGPRPRTTCD